MSTICQAIRAEYAAWCERDLSGIVLYYLFLDASRFKMHPNAGSEPVLAAWGITTDGKPVSSGSRRPHPRAPTPGKTSSPACSSAACTRRCW